MLNHSAPEHASASHAPALNDPALPERRPSPLWRLWTGWIGLTGPHASRFSKAISAQERLRRARLISALLVMIVAVLGLLIPSLFVQPLIWRPVILLAAGSVLVALLNRRGQVTLSGLTYVVLVDAALAGYIVTKPIFTYGNVPNLDLFILALLVSGIVLPRRFILLVALVHIGLILAIFHYKPHDDLLTTGIARYFAGQSYTAYLNAILLQVCGAGIAWLHAWSVERALLRASRAEELAQAQAQIEEQARLLAEQKARLEHSILMLQVVQTQIAGGDLTARVSLQGNDLLPLAVNFNLLVERLSRVERTAQDYRRLERAIQQLLEATSLSAADKDGTAPPTTGTLADSLVPALMQRRRLLEHLREGGKQAEDLAVVLRRQQEYSFRAENALRDAQGLTAQLALAVQQQRASGQMSNGSSGALGTGGLGKREEPPTPASVRALLEQERLLLEEVSRLTAQSRELGTRCAKGAHRLSQQLLEAR